MTQRQKYPVCGYRECSYYKRNKGKKSLTAYIVFSIAVILAYTVVEFIVSAKTGMTHDTLTTCFYACFGGEILACALIKIFKLKGETNNG